jgi:hypothetical protein
VIDELATDSAPRGMSAHCWCQASLYIHAARASVRARSARWDTGRTVCTPAVAGVDTSHVDFPSDSGLVAVALRFGVAPNALLGHGGEAWVYALDDERVLRVLRDGGGKADVLRRMALVEELAPPHRSATCIFLLTPDSATSSQTTRSSLRHGARTYRSVRPGISRGRRPSSGKSTLPALPTDFPTHPAPRSST